MVFKKGKQKGICPNCNEGFYLIQPHQVYCDLACKQQAYRKRQKALTNG